MRWMSYDTETTGLQLHYGKRMFSYSTCTDDGTIDVRRLDGSRSRVASNSLHLQKLMDEAKQKRVAIVMHNSKFDLLATEYYLDSKLAEDIVFHDTYLQSHLLHNNHMTHALDDLAWELASFPRDNDKRVQRFARGKDYQNVPEELMDPYQEDDAERTALLHAFMYPLIAANPNWLECYQTEIDLIPVTMRMEQRGIMLDKKRCLEMRDKLHTDAECVLDSVEDYCGRRLNLNGGPDIGWFLYEFAKLPVLKRTAKTQQPSTDKEVLNELRLEHNHPAIELLMQYRSWARGAKMMDNYYELADADGTIYPTIHTCEAVTSRESCRNPNLQNVQKSGVLTSPYSIPARRVFRPRPDCINIHIDYSGIELRILVHYSGEPELIEIIRNGGDVHAEAATVFYRSDFTNATDKAVRKTYRDASKNANFAIPYGASAAKVCHTLNLPYSIGSIRYADYKRRWPRITNLTNTIAAQVRQVGYVETVFGRRLHVPREMAYVGTNYATQGSAAEVIKRAQIRVDRLLRGSALCLLLPIHDEIVVQCPRSSIKYLPEVMPEIRRVMIDFPQFSVPLEIEASVCTRDWATKKELAICH